MSVLSAIASQIITTKGGAVGGISIPSEVVKHLDTSAFKIIVLVIWVVVCAFIFDYTKFGRREKFVGEIQSAPSFPVLNTIHMQYLDSFWRESALESAHL